jgi:hypothetical protein
MVMVSVVGKDPVSSNLLPISALMRVLLPALNSPATTTQNVELASSTALGEGLELLLELLELLELELLEAVW